ncbi:MAG: hypothetical protein LBP87_06495 [Planctomycetaceae bacterium]|nr:hypothetical protein [Planctomycetaceae bacterium]
MATIPAPVLQTLSTMPAYPAINCDIVVLRADRVVFRRQKLPENR